MSTTASAKRRNPFRSDLDRKFDSSRWRNVFEKKEEISVVDWAEQNIILSSKSTSSPGPLRTHRIPFAREIMNAFGDRSVESITGVMGSQICKTEIQKVCISFAVVRDPGPAMWVWPNIDLCKKFARTRFDPMVDDCPKLASLRMTDRESWTATEKRFFTMDLMFRGSNSPANLSSFPIRYLMMDEVDKYPMASEREAGALELAIHRTQSFWNRKILAFSSPTITDGQIWQRFLEGDQRYYWLPCPYCQSFQVLQTSQIQCDESCRIGEHEWDFEKVFSSAAYYCEHCGEAIHDEQKPAMLLQGEWRPAGREGNHRSYQLSRLYSPWANARFGHVLVAFLRSAHNPEKLHDFTNNWEGKPWENQVIPADESMILAHRADYDEGTIPGPPYCVMLTVDVQDDRIYYVVRAWGTRGTSWLVRYGIAGGLEEIPVIASNRFPFEVPGQPPGVAQIRPEDVWIDSGYRPDEVYKLCRRYGYTPIKGEKENSRPWEYPIKKSRTTDRLLLIEGARFKGELYRHFETPLGPDGSWYLHKQTTTAYAKQLLGEKPVRERDAHGREHIVWKKRWANHWMDCEVYQCAACLWKNCRDWQGARSGVRSRSIQLNSQAPNGPGGY